MVHGDCVSIGCYAMTDQGIETIYQLVEAALKYGPRKVPVHIFPFRMTDEELANHTDSPWIDFWQNLKQGHDLFETTGRVPTVEAADRRYVFESS